MNLLKDKTSNTNSFNDTATSNLELDISEMNLAQYVSTRELINRK